MSKLSAIVYLVGVNDFFVVGSDNLVRIDNLRLANSNQHITDATVAGQMVDETGANVGSSFTLTNIPAQSGRYEGTIEDSIGLVQGKIYTCQITATKGTDIAVWHMTRRARAAQV